MSAEQQLVEAVVPIVTAGITAHFGIRVERHFVSRHAIHFNIATLIVSMIPVLFAHQYAFLTLTAYSGLGIAMLRKYGTRNGTVGFFFGSKSIGAIGIWVGVINLKIADAIITWFIQVFYGTTPTFDPIIFPLEVLAILLIAIHALGRVPFGRRR